MNIFVVDRDPSRAAVSLCDKHVGKMLIESAQMLSTVARSQGLSAQYKSTHSKHPCTIWCGKSRENWSWLIEHATTLSHEYAVRFGHRHKTSTVIDDLHRTPVKFDVEQLTPFALAMPEQFKRADPVESYRLYYHTKSTFAKWDRGREPPTWWCL